MRTTINPAIDPASTTINNTIITEDIPRFSGVFLVMALTGLCKSIAKNSETTNGQITPSAYLIHKYPMPIHMAAYRMLIINDLRFSTLSLSIFEASEINLPKKAIIIYTFYTIFLKVTINNRNFHRKFIFFAEI